MDVWIDNIHFKNQKKPDTKEYQFIILVQRVQKEKNTDFYVRSQGSD